MTTEEPAAPSSEELVALRSRLRCGEAATQAELDGATERLSTCRRWLRPNEKDERFALVDGAGRPLKLNAPRWLCHSLGLRHVAVHVLLRWPSPGLGNVFVLQVRSWDKADSPGQLDISVGGHVVGDVGQNVLETAYREMEEELGVVTADLESGGLKHVAGYEFNEEREGDNFFNVEWRELYLGDILPSAMERIRFQDREVVGLYLCPESEARRFLSQTFLPLASALTNSLPRCLDL